MPMPVDIGIGLADSHLMSRKVILAILAAIASVIVMNVVTESLVVVNGLHASGHLASAQGPFALVAVLGLVIWTLARDQRRNPLIWMAALVIVAGGVIDTTGNLQVVDAIDGASWSDSEAQELGSSRPGFDDGHDLASTGMWIAVGGATVFAIVLAGLGTVSWPVAIGSALLSLIWPPWIAPGFGLLVVAIARVRAMNRLERSDPPAGPEMETVSA